MATKLEYKTTEAKRATNKAYENSVEKTLVRFAKNGDLRIADVRAAADAAGEALNAYIVRAIRERMEREGVEI